MSKTNSSTVEETIRDILAALKTLDEVSQKTAYEVLAGKRRANTLETSIEKSTNNEGE